MRTNLPIILGIIGVVGAILVFLLNKRSVLRSLAGVCAILVACIFSYQLFLPLSRGVSVYSLKWMVLVLCGAPLLVFVVLHTTYSVFASSFAKRAKAPEPGFVSAGENLAEKAFIQDDMLLQREPLAWESAMPPKVQSAVFDDISMEAVFVEEQSHILQPASEKVQFISEASEAESPTFDEAERITSEPISEVMDCAPKIDVLLETEALQRYFYKTLAFMVIRPKRHDEDALEQEIGFTEEALEQEIGFAEEAVAAEIEHIVEETGSSPKSRRKPKTLALAVTRRRRPAKLVENDIYNPLESEALISHENDHIASTEAPVQHVQEMNDILETKHEKTPQHNPDLLAQAAAAKSEGDIPRAERLLKEYLCGDLDPSAKFRANELLLECYVARKALAEARPLAQALLESADGALAQKLRLIVRFLG